MKRSPPEPKGYVERTVRMVPSCIARELQALDQEGVAKLVKATLAKNTDAIYPIGATK